MKPLRDFCRQWPLERNQTGIMATGRNPKSFWLLVKRLEKTQIQFISLMSWFTCYYINVQDTAEIKQ